MWEHRVGRRSHRVNSSYFIKNRSFKIYVLSGGHQLVGYKNHNMNDPYMCFGVYLNLKKCDKIYINNQLKHNSYLLNESQLFV